MKRVYNAQIGKTPGTFPGDPCLWAWESLLFGQRGAIITLASGFAFTRGSALRQARRAMRRHEKHARCDRYEIVRLGTSND